MIAGPRFIWDLQTGASGRLRARVLHPSSAARLGTPVQHHVDALLGGRNGSGRMCSLISARMCSLITGRTQWLW